jgi:hypothetical protein
MIESVFRGRTGSAARAAVLAALLSVLAPAGGAVSQSPTPGAACIGAGLVERIVGAAPTGSSVVEATQLDGQQWSDLFSLGSASEQLAAEALRAYAARLGQLPADLCIVSVVLIDTAGAYTEVKAVDGGSATNGLIDGAPAIFGAPPGAQVATPLPGTTIPSISWTDLLGQPFQAIEAGAAVWIARQGDAVLQNLAAAVSAPSPLPA